MSDPTYRETVVLNAAPQLRPAERATCFLDELQRCSATVLSSFSATVAAS